MAQNVELGIKRHFQGMSVSGETRVGFQCFIVPQAVHFPGKNELFILLSVASAPWALRLLLGALWNKAIKNPAANPSYFHLQTPLIPQEFRPSDQQERGAAGWERIPLARDREEEKWAESAQTSWAKHGSGEGFGEWDVQEHRVLSQGGETSPVLGYSQGKSGRSYHLS